MDSPIHICEMPLPSGTLLKGIITLNTASPWVFPGALWVCEAGGNCAHFVEEEAEAEGGKEALRLGGPEAWVSTQLRFLHITASRLHPVTGDRCFSSQTPGFPGPFLSHLSRLRQSSCLLAPTPVELPPCCWPWAWGSDAVFQDAMASTGPSPAPWGSSLLGGHSQGTAAN